MGDGTVCCLNCGVSEAVVTVINSDQITYVKYVQFTILPYASIKLFFIKKKKTKIECEGLENLHS